MRFDKGYKYFVSNSVLVSVLWVLGMALSFVTIAFALDTFRLWGVIVFGVISVSLIVAAIFATVLLRCCADYDGISAVSHWHRQYVAWQDISSVKISCRIEKSGPLYDIVFENDELEIKYKNSVRTAISSKTCFLTALPKR